MRFYARVVSFAAELQRLPTAGIAIAAWRGLPAAVGARQCPFHSALPGKIIGSVRASEMNGTVRIGKLMVHPDFRRRGYGSKLIKAIEECFPGMRYELFTSTRSVDNIRLYESLGYKIFDRKKIDEELVFVYMEKD